MKKWFILIGILAVLFIGGYFVLSFYAVKFIQPHLQKVMGPGFTLEEIKLKTTYLSAKGIQYEDPRFKTKIPSDRGDEDLSLSSFSFEKIFTHKRIYHPPALLFLLSISRGGHRRSLGDDEKGKGRKRDFRRGREEERKSPFKFRSIGFESRKAPSILKIEKWENLQHKSD